MVDTLPLSSVCVRITKGTTPTQADGGFAFSGVNYIKSECLSYDGQIAEDRFSFISEHTHERLSRSKIQDRDILYSIAGANLGKCGIAKARMLPANTNQAVAIIRVDPNRASPEFISYVLRARSFVQSVLGGVAQSAQPNVNLADIGRFRIPNWPVSRQIEIADILRSLDDRIELNGQIGQTLQSIAQAIFRDWFVEFGPVRRKLDAESDPVAIMGGLVSDREYAGKLAALFPGEMSDLPLGWQMSTLGETTTAVLGGTPARKVAEYWGGPVPWINSGEVNEFRITRPSEFITEKGLAKSATKLLPRRTTVLAITGATLGQVSLTEIETCANQSVVGLIPDGPLPAEFVYLSVKSFIDDIVARQTGGAQQHINKGNVEEQPVLLPSSAVLAAWSEISEPIFDRIAACCFESRTLAETRDYLLPRLMSGEARLRSVPHTEAA